LTSGHKIQKETGQSPVKVHKPKTVGIAQWESLENIQPGNGTLSGYWELGETL